MEWELDEVNRAGEHFHLTGVTALRARGGKAAHVHDYIPDQDVLERAWPPATAHAWAQGVVMGESYRFSVATPSRARDAAVDLSRTGSTHP